MYAAGVSVVRYVALAPLEPVMTFVDDPKKELTVRLTVWLGIVVPLGIGSTDVVLHGCWESGQVPRRFKSLLSGPVGPSSYAYSSLSARYHMRSRDISNVS